MPAVISARGLVKRYGDFTAVDGIDFDIEQGESFGFLGPNGAGKSTTMRMISAVSTRTDGTLDVLGLDTNDHGPEIRAQLGVVPQADTLDTELRARDNLVVYGRYFGLSRTEVGERAETRRRVELEQRTLQCGHHGHVPSVRLFDVVFY